MHVLRAHICKHRERKRELSNSRDTTAWLAVGWLAGWLAGSLLAGLLCLVEQDALLWVDGLISCLTTAYFW